MPEALRKGAPPGPTLHALARLKWGLIRRNPDYAEAVRECLETIPSAVGTAFQPNPPSPASLFSPRLGERVKGEGAALQANAASVAGDSALAEARSRNR